MPRVAIKMSSRKCDKNFVACSSLSTNKNSVGDKNFNGAKANFLLLDLFKMFNLYNECGDVHKRLSK